MIRRIEISVPGNRYDVVIGPGAVNDILLILNRLRADSVAVIVDQRVGDLHLPRLMAAIDRPTTVIQFPPGEASKSLEMAARCYDSLAENRLGREGVIVTLGGGVAGDLGGFVAATWLRGVRCIQVATSLEAAIDASIGGKTAVNHATAKNLIGAFHQPAAVLVDSDFLQTLPDRELVAALAESVKHAAIRSPERVKWSEEHAQAVSRRDPATLAELIAWNCQIKADVVAADERELGVRVILNYGHTIGHALELCLGYELRHGECVGLGIIAENQIAIARGLLDLGVAQRIEALLVQHGLPARLPRSVSAVAVTEACRRDKKSRGGTIHVLTLAGLGAPARLEDVREEEIVAALASIS